MIGGLDCPSISLYLSLVALLTFSTEFLYFFIPFFLFLNMPKDIQTFTFERPQNYDHIRTAIQRRTIRRRAVRPIQHTPSSGLPSPPTEPIDFEPKPTKDSVNEIQHKLTLLREEKHRLFQLFKQKAATTSPALPPQPSILPLSPPNSLVSSTPKIASVNLPSKRQRPSRWSPINQSPFPSCYPYPIRPPHFPSQPPSRLVSLRDH
ncbi:hypothetical protein CLU79DRAFT_133196 [Phycomyces nitens]|nr:hypothetical protein CLU79DRAFT_133196 [Phycomyces nitens]